MSQQVSSNVPPSTDWPSLPDELKLKIARYVTTADTARHPTFRGCPAIPDLDSTLRAVNKQTNQLFCDIVRKDYLHIRISSCDCGRRSRSPLFVQLANHFERPGRVRDVKFYERSLKIDLSALDIQIMCNSGCTGKCVRNTIMLATPESMLTLYAILHNFLPYYRNRTMQVDGRCHSPTANAQAIKILEEMRSIVRSIRVTTGPGIQTDYNVDSFCKDLGRRVKTAKQMIDVFESHLDMVQNAMDEGISLEQFVSSLLFYSSAMMEDRLPEPEGIWEAESGRTNYRLYLFRLELMYDCLILRGMANYLLSRKLTFEGQCHFFLVTQALSLRLSDVLCMLDDMVYYFEREDPHSTGYSTDLDWMAPILKARVEFLLAWARLNTMARYPIEGRQPTPEPPMLNDLVYTGDNLVELFHPSTWGTPKSMLLVAGQSLKMLEGWIDGAANREAKEGMYPMDREANELWMWRMKELADAIDHAQKKKGYDPTMGRKILEDEMVDESLCVKLCYLPRGEMRRELHENLIDDDSEDTEDE